MRIAQYAAQELKTDFLKQASRSEVALENFSLNFSQAECAEGIACDQMRGGGADTFAPVGTSDDDSKFSNTLLFGRAFNRARELRCRLRCRWAVLWNEKSSRQGGR